MSALDHIFRQTIPLTGTLSNQGKKRAHKGIDEECNNVIGDINKELMPALRNIRLLSCE